VVARRTMTLRRIDPWSVLKFGFVINICAAIVFVLGFGILWFVIGELGIIEQACQLAEDVGFEDCGVDAGALFRVVVLFAALAAVIMTGIAVFGAFLHNLLAELVGGIQFTVVEEGGRDTLTRRRETRTAVEEPAARGDRAGDDEATTPAGHDVGPRWTLGSPPASDRAEEPEAPPRQEPRPAGPGGDGGDDEDAVFGRRERR
jgi:hypothetical protein